MKTLKEISVEERPLTHRSGCLYTNVRFCDLKTCLRAGQVAGTFLKRALITILFDFLVMTPGS